MELVKLFGLLRSDGIFPSAVTLGQYTRALAEGYSKRSIGTADDNVVKTDDPATGNKRLDTVLPKAERLEPGIFLSSLDGNLKNLEEAGRRWRQKKYHEQDLVPTQGEQSLDDNSQLIQVDQQKKRSSKPWLPVSTSSSFLVHTRPSKSASSSGRLEKESIRLVAMWSRSQACECTYCSLL